MRIFQTSAICLLATSWLAGSAPAENQDSGHNSFGLKPASAAQDTQTPPKIILNGIMTASGDKRALFKVEPTQAAGEHFYFLLEGERAGGIELLSVDAKACAIKVNNHGVIQNIALCQPPRLLSTPGTGAPAGGNGINLPGGQGILSGGGQTGQTVGGEIPGAAAGQFSPSGFAGGTGKPGAPASGSSANNNNDPGSQNGGGADTGSAEAGTTDTGTANSGTQKEEPFWVRASREFEQLRIQTADAVRSGVDEPIPLTPLTPAGTPADLIGPDRAWFFSD